MPLGATETGLGAATARGWAVGSHARLAGLGGPMAGEGLLGWTGAGVRSVLAGGASLGRLDYRPVAGFGGLVATWVAGALLAGLLGLFPGLGGPLARACNAGAGREAGRNNCFHCTAIQHCAKPQYSTVPQHEAKPGLSMHLASGKRMA